MYRDCATHLIASSPQQGEAGATVFPILPVKRPVQKYQQPAQSPKTRTRRAGLGSKSGLSDSTA